MDAPTRGNYDSGEDFVLEYGELRFTFNERVSSNSLPVTKDSESKGT